MRTPICPGCGAEDGMAQLDSILAKAWFNRIESNGEVEWSGDTEVLWDTQEALNTNDPQWLCYACGESFSPDEVVEATYPKEATE